MANQLTNVGGVWALQTMTTSSGGTSSQTQFNDSGSFGGDSGLLFDSPTSALSGVTVKATALTGSLTKLSNGSSYLVAGSNVTLVTGSSGQVTISTSGYSSATSVISAATVEASGSVQSSAYTDPTNVGPSVTMTTGTSVICHIYAATYSEAAVLPTAVSVAISGATTLAASDSPGANGGGCSSNTLVSTFNYFNHSASLLFTGLTPGSNTFTMKYRASTASKHWYEKRRIVVQRID